MTLLKMSLSIIIATTTQLHSSDGLPALAKLANAAQEVQSMNRATMPYKSL